MAKAKPAPSALLQAAAALDEALAQHGRATRELVKVELDSKKALARASEAVARLAQREDELAAAMRGLGQVLGDVQVAQQADAERAQARAAEVLERRGVLERIVERQEMLGHAVRAVGQLLEQVRAGGDGVGPAALDEVLARIAELGDLAEGLSRDAGAAEFADVASECHALRQQLDAAHARAGQLRGVRPQA